MTSSRTRRLALGLLGAWAAGGIPDSAEAQDISARNGSTVTLGGRVQVQYEYSGREDVASSFFIRRAWVTMDGRLNDLVSGRVQFDAKGSNVLEAYLAISPSRSFQLQVGQFKRAMSYFWLAANSQLPIIERDGRVTGVQECPGVRGVCSFGQLTGSLGLDTYEPGLLATGRFGGGEGGRLGYRVTLTNGEGIDAKDVNNEKSASGQFSVFLGENSRLSAYAALDETVCEEDDETCWLPATGIEFESGTWRRKGPHLLANFVRGRNWKVGEDAQFKALQVMGAWHLPLAEDRSVDAVEPLLRVSWASTEDASGADVSGVVLTPGFMVYLAGWNGIAANLDLYRTIADPDSNYDDMEWSFKVQAFMFF